MAPGCRCSRWPRAHPSLRPGRSPADSPGSDRKGASTPWSGHHAAPPDVGRGPRGANGYQIRPSASIITGAALEDAVRLASVYRPLSVTLAVGSALALVAGWLTQPPWLLALVLVA